MPLLSMACPNCLKMLHSDEVWFDNPESGERECSGCGCNIGEYTKSDLQRVYDEREKAEASTP